MRHRSSLPLLLTLSLLTASSMAAAPELEDRGGTNAYHLGEPALGTRLASGLEFLASWLEALLDRPAAGISASNGIGSSKGSTQIDPWGLSPPPPAPGLTTSNP